MKQKPGQEKAIIRKTTGKGNILLGRKYEMDKIWFRKFKER